MRSLRAKIAAGVLQLGVVTLLSILPAAPLHAQSAADKATARQLATQGIRFYDEGKYVEALDNLQRAQSLYDAPVHLLYIARAQVKLGKLVEGSETYRRLARTALAADAPQAFRDAVEDGKTELAEVEAKIPSIRIDVSPPNAPGIELQVDGEAVSAAALGVDRPINPGEHRIRVAAQGYAPAEATVSVNPGEKKPVSLKLTPATGAAAGSPEAGPGASPTQESAPAPAATAAKGNIGFAIGLRLGGMAVSGAFIEGTPASDAIENAGGAGIYGGFRFAKYFTGLILLDAFAAKPGVAFDLQEGMAPDGISRIDNTASMTDFGLGLRIGSAIGKFGGFGQAEFLPLHRYEVSSDRTNTSGGTCSASIGYNGTALRVGGGVSIPIVNWLQITPLAHWTIGRYTSVEASEDCMAGPIPPGVRADSTDIDKPGTHSFFFLGVAGEYLFGPDKPAK